MKSLNFKYKFGLVGKGISHSFSKELHKYFGNYEYNLYDLDEHEIKDFILRKNYKGLNITMPYKRIAYNLCDFISSEAKEIGCVNTIVNREGKIYGYNTDFFGFKSMLIYNGITLKDKKVIILGSGGASLTVQAVARSMEAKEIIVISRTGKNNYGNISKHFDADVVINATPVGMYPNLYDEIIDISKFENCKDVIDIIYNPLRTRLLAKASLCGKNTVNGLMMLIMQGLEASNLFMGKSQEISIDKIKYCIERNKRNVILIGMPSSGKTTLGRVVSKELNMRFIDSDEEIYIKYGKTPEEIISAYGEEKFRIIEKDVILDISKLNGVVISTGGGVILNDENMINLMTNGTIFYVERSLNLLDKNSLPAKRAGNLESLYNQRKKLYRKYSEYVVDNNGTINEARLSLINRVIYK